MLLLPHFDFKFFMHFCKVLVLLILCMILWWGYGLKIHVDALKQFFPPVLFEFFFMIVIIEVVI